MNDTEKMILSLIRVKPDNTSKGLNLQKEYKRIKRIGTIRRGYCEVLKYSHPIEQIRNRMKKWY